MEFKQPMGVGRMIVDIGKRKMTLSFAAAGIGRI